MRHHPYYPHPHHATQGLSDVTLPGIIIPPYGAYQYFRGSPREHERESGFSSTLVIAAMVGAGVLGYLVYRNLIVSTSAIRGASHEFSSEGGR